MATYNENEVHSAPGKGDVLRVMLDQHIHNIAIQGERYIVDFNTYKQLHSDSPKFKTKYPYINSTGRRELPLEVMECDTPPEGLEPLTFPNTLTGYNLRQKKWGELARNTCMLDVRTTNVRPEDLQVGLVHPVVRDKKAFGHLVIGGGAKGLIQALVATRLGTDQGTDLIQGKGNGLIILLHGGPGTGKTFPAESVAEFAEKPLFRVTCGDIGTKPEEVEKYIECVLHLGKTWDCVRNAPVSVFLRVLEYYEGILVLTSNRAGTFDEAFKSRVQLSLHYETLDRSQRRKQQESGVASRSIEEEKEGGRRDDKGINYDEIDCCLTDLADEEMNGQQIRNAITTARQLAKFKGVKVSRRFDKYLQKVQEGYTDDQLARGDGIR
ncbi:hypothetical protein OQA88_1905 [Cercophora sp. LCS_1]